MHNIYEDRAIGNRQRAIRLEAAIIPLMIITFHEGECIRASAGLPAEAFVKKSTDVNISI